MKTDVQMFTYIMAAMAEDPEVVAFCERKLNSKVYQASAATKKFRDDLLHFFEEHDREVLTCSEISAMMKEEMDVAVSVQKVSAGCRFLVKEGQISEVQRENDNAKSPKRYENTLRTYSEK